MDELLPHYERELSVLRSSMRTFAEDFPKVAARLAISGEHSGDLHVERMIQSFALLAARLDAKLEDEYPEFTEAMLETLHPQHLRPFPSCSVVQFSIGGLFDRLTGTKTIRSGSQFISTRGGYRFRSVYDVALVPLKLEDVRYAVTAFAPTGVSLPAQTSGVLSITFAGAGGHTGLSLAPARVRVYLSGQREVVAAAADTLLLRSSAAFIEADGSGQWKRLQQVPVHPVGFEPSDSVLGERDDSTSSLLMEYFAFPEKFDFVDIDFAALKRAAPLSRRITLHLPVVGVHQDSWAAQRLSTLSAENLKLFCTPVVNLFDCEAAPIETSESASHYPVVPQAPEIADTAVWSINAVRLARPGASGELAIRPLRSLLHGSAGQLQGPYWLVVRDERVAQENPGYETKITLVNPKGAAAVTNTAELAIELTCTNRNLPSAMAFGARHGDLELREDDLHCPVVLLRRPTASIRPSARDGALWRIISYMARQPVQVDNDGLEELKRLFRYYSSLSAAPSRQIDGLSFLNHRSSMQWIDRPPSPSFVRGLEITLTVDEQAFGGSSLSVFANVMDRFFANYASVNSFVQLILLSKNTGAELKRCASRQGLQPLI
ncbi:type VI secretion system protein ImpG [Paraburkholderia terricola]|uniref:type VI secretion system baseplate subunit TssF n=1 Tax=Paraburkholderia terricola TaxID=169427 RepID=UPI0028669B65|nr:type VI secretion system baseplate subunit TssF [Paraburkholderia terricola]MDR6496293.1 type VI secretion system protein ImpG [Paraburkholderia terricola]